MRVVFDARYLDGDSSGIGTYCRNLIHELLELEPRLSLGLVTRKGGLAAQFQSGRCEDVRFAAAPRSLRTLYTLPRLLRAEPGAVFHSPFNIIPSSLPCPSIVTIHDVMWLQDPANITHNPLVRWTAGAFWRTRVRHAARHATHIAAVSEATKAALLELFPDLPSARVSVTPNGVSPYFFQAPTESEHLAMQRCVGDHPFVLCVGNESPHKNHLRAVRAFLQAFEPGSPWRLVLVRRAVRHDPEMERLLASPDAQARVIVLGHTDLPTLRALYAAARLLFFPSWVEGFGIPILESMACGSPVLTSDVGAPKEVAGDAAALVDPFDVTAMAGALLRVASDDALRSTLIERGKLRAAEFTWKRCAEATLLAYEQTLRGPGPHSSRFQTEESRSSAPHPSI